MAIDKKDAKVLWTQWTHGAVTRYVIPDDIEDTDELVDDMTDVAVKYADSMLEEYEDRFGGGSRGTGRRRSSENPKDT